METFLIYLLKSSGIIALFLLFYILFLKRETFFRANRIYLLAGLGLAIIVPLLVFTKTIWLQPMPMYQIQIPDQLGVALAKTNPIDWTSLILYGYCSGVFLFSVRFAVQLLSLKRLIGSGKKIRKEKFIRIETKQKSSPFSFFTYLVYNPAHHTSSELKTILAHEKVHAEERHSLDMLAMQLFTIFQWCNPFVWWYRVCLNDNLEYMVDQQTVAQNAVKTDYQYLLLRTVMEEKHYPMTPPFFNNSIKKRIVMLNKNRSDRKNSFKYALMLPLLVGFIFLFNVKTEAQIKPNPRSTNSESPKKGNIQEHSENENEYNPVTYEKEHSGDFPNNKYSPPPIIDNPTEAKEILKLTENVQHQFYVGDKNPLYLVNGKEAFKNEVDNLNPNSIESITVWKGQQASDKYGDVGKNGVVEIILKKNYQYIPKTEYADDQKVRRPSKLIIHDSITGRPLVTGESSGVKLEGPDKGQLVILDGKEVPYSTIDSLRPESIESVSVWKGEKAIEKYGDKGKNGVIEIVTKKE